MSDADRIFLETTRRLAARRLAQEDVHAALQLAQVEPGKPVADLGCGYGRHLRELVQYGHRATGIDRGALLLTTDNPLRLAANPHVKAEHDVPGLGKMLEEGRFDGAVDHVRKTVRLQSGEVLEAQFHIRYYPPAALAALAYVA